MSNRPTAPLYATVNITTVCNLDCAYCFMKPLAGEHMSLPDFKRVVDELADMKIFFLNISGGEAFLHPELTEFLKIVRSTFRHAMILTNGTAFKQEHLEVITDSTDTLGGLSVQVSLDAYDNSINQKTRGKNQAVLNNIKKLYDLDINFSIAMVVTRFNIDSILDSIKTLSRFTKHFHLMTLQNVRKSPLITEKYCVHEQTNQLLWERVNSFANEYNLNINTPTRCERNIGIATGAPCASAFTHLVIDPNLQVRPCDRLTDVVIGNLRQSTLNEIWNSDSVKPIINSSVPYCRLDQILSYN